MKRSSITRNRKEKMIRNLDFNYDKPNDLLYVYSKKGSVYTNVVVGEFHIEFSREGEVVGVEVLNASDLLKEYGISKRLLENITSVALKIVVRGSSLLVFMIISALNEERTATITLNNLDSPLMKAVTEA
jgi:uncharacterized protein YuzE